MVHLRIKEQNKKRYYYLEHTIRKGSHFSNERLYLGSRLPKDIGITKEQFLQELLLRRYEKTLTAIKGRFSRDFSKRPYSAKKQYIESFMVKFTYNTNRIEGSTLSLKETADLLQQHITPRNKPLQDVKEE